MSTIGPGRHCQMRGFTMMSIIALLFSPKTRCVDLDRDV
jgi:hypothetical protein